MGISPVCKGDTLMQADHEAFDKAVKLLQSRRHSAVIPESPNLARLPVDIPENFKKQLKLIALREDTTMRDLVLESITMLFVMRESEIIANESNRG